MQLWTSINAWWKSSCTPAGRPIKPQCLQCYHRDSNWEIWVVPPSYSDACQGLLTFWMQWVVKRLQEHMGDQGRLTTPLFISFTLSPALCSILWRNEETLLDRWGEERREKGTEKGRETRGELVGLQNGGFLFPWQSSSQFIIVLSWTKTSHFLEFVQYIWSY